MPSIVQSVAQGYMGTASGGTVSASVTLAGTPTVGNLLTFGFINISPTPASVMAVPGGWETVLNNFGPYGLRAAFTRVVQVGDGMTWGFTVPDTESPVAYLLGIWELQNVNSSSPVAEDAINQAFGTSPWNNWITSTPTALGQLPLCMANMTNGNVSITTLSMTTTGWSSDAQALPGAHTGVLLAHGPLATSLSSTNLSSTISVAFGSLCEGFTLLVSGPSGGWHVGYTAWHA